MDTLCIHLYEFIKQWLDTVLFCRKIIESLFINSACLSFRRLRPAYCWLVRNLLPGKIPDLSADRQARFACGNDAKGNLNYSLCGARYISGLLSLKISLNAFKVLSLAAFGSISVIIKASSFSGARIKISPFGETIPLFPMKRREGPSFLFSVPVLLAVIANTLFSKTSERH